jgi:hypothetical protein
MRLPAKLLKPINLSTRARGFKGPTGEEIDLNDRHRQQFRSRLPTPPTGRVHRTGTGTQESQDSVQAGKTGSFLVKRVWLASQRDGSTQPRAPVISVRISSHHHWHFI